MAVGGCVDRGQADEVPGDRATIVSLNPCTDAILAELAAPDQLLAISHYSHDPRSSSMDAEAARKYALTGGTAEEILVLRPDIVVASDFIAPSTRQAFADLGIRVETFGIATSVADSKAHIAELASLTGNASAGDALIAKIDAALRDTDPGNAEPLSAVLWQPSGIVPGESTLVSQLMQHTGFASHSAARGMAQADYLSLEQMLSDPPQVLLLAGQERSQSHPALDRLSTHRAAFDSGLLYCGGPTIIRAVQRLKDIRAEAL